MRRSNLFLKCLAASLLLAATINFATEAHLRERFFLRRQSPPVSEAPEKESTTNAGEAQAPPPRLYPDLPRPPEVDPQESFGRPPMHNPTSGGFAGPASPFLPSFGFQTGSLPGVSHTPGSPFFRMQTIRPAPPALSPSERQQSLSFTNGLGARLLAMMGIKSTERRSDEAQAAGSVPTTALQNETVLSQLNKGVHTIYGGLSRMYNTTVQQQLNLLQERFNRETGNSTSAWQQRMAKQVPEFFKQIAARVNEAQENLNKVMHQVGQTITNTSALESSESPKTRNFFDHFSDSPIHPHNFFNQFGFNGGFNGLENGSPPGSGPQQQQHAESNLVGRMRNFWHEQVQPQIGYVRGQVSRVWRELSTNVMVPQQDQFANRNSNTNNNSQSYSDLVDDILKMVDVSNSDFVLFDYGQPAEQAMKAERLQQAASEQNQQQRLNRTSQAIAQSQQIIQNGLMSAQRELNQLWGGLSNSLQATVARVRSIVRPQQRNPFGPSQAPGTNQGQAGIEQADPAENEIDGRLREMNKLQREADGVYETVQRQQQQLQGSGFRDNFRHFFHQFNNQLEHIPNRLGDSVNRFGTAVNDLWGQIPTRWNNFMENMRQPQPEVTRQAASSTPKPS